MDVTACKGLAPITFGDMIVVKRDLLRVAKIILFNTFITKIGQHPFWQLV
jgi:hypothetical protein